MANPASLAWAIEMWAWALLGMATWLVAPVFSKGRLERLTARVFVANGVLSIVGALVTAAHPGWEVTSAGLAAFASWNILVFAMSALALLVLRQRSRHEERRVSRPRLAIRAHQTHHAEGT
jgi:hypothetical protein